MVAAHGVSAIGWARAQQGAVLGQQLDFSAALRLDPGDSIAPECVTAEVMVGDQRLPPGAVRVLVDGSSPETLAMRVLSATAVDEPVVAITLSIGCPARMSRRFVLLADPPALSPTASMALAPQMSQMSQMSQTAQALLLAQADRSGARPALDPPDAPAAAVAQAPRAGRSTQPDARPPRPAASTRKPARPAVAPPAVAPVARLRLDAADPIARPGPAAANAAAASAPGVVEEAIQAVALAASATRAAASAASAADSRIALLERSIGDLRIEARANRDLVAQMRERLAAAEGGSRWTLPLLLAALALAGLVLWLAWRLRVLQREQQAAWRRAAAAEAAPQRGPVATSQLPLVTSELHLPTLPAAGAAQTAAARGAPWPTVVPPVPQVPLVPLVPRTSGANSRSLSPATMPQTTQPQQPRPRPQPAAPPRPAVLPAVAVAPAVAPPTAVAANERTQVLPPQALPDDGSPRDVSIEELLDLEQQAEFFVVLGQDDAAIDLLVDHLRNTGGGSPLPYLKLLELYRRRNEREAYERTRTRFNHRFNAYAPEWNADLQQGRALEDYVGVLPRLQQVWPRPLDAMAELEALLFRKSRGELFELPAYREVLFLYSLARDLLDREAADTGNVDLLLPLADGGEFSATAPHPYFGMERDSVFDAQHEDRPTAPVDLDLTQPDADPVILHPRTPVR